MRDFLRQAETSELGRRAVHASGTALPLGYLLGVVTWPQLQYILLALSLVVIALETLRLVVGVEWWVLQALFDELAREYEQENVAGYALYMFSMTAVALVFRPAIAVSGMLMLTVGDPISGILGRSGASSTKRAGVLTVMFSVCFCLALAVLRWASVPLWVAALAATAGALGATLADGLKPVVAGYVIDDNISIPPAAAVGMWVVLRLV